MAWDIVYGQGVDVGRNSVVKRFLTSKHYADFDYLLMHDTDASWSPGALQRLVDRNVAVITGMIFKRSIPTVPTVGKFVNTDVEGHHMYSFKDTINKIKDISDREIFDLKEMKNELLLDKTPGDVVEVDGAGAHFMLIHRDVLTAIGDNWYQCIRQGAGEDYDFCRKVKQAGFKIHADFSVFTGHHLGSLITVGLREFLHYTSKERLETEWIA